MRLPLHKSLAVSVALCAMVLRALLPDGWMPSAGASASPFVICTADGAHRDGKPAPAPKRSHAPCAFAAAAPLAPPQAVGVAVAKPSRILDVPASQHDDRLATSAQYPPNAARAPPAFS